MDTRHPGKPSSQLTWANVGFAFCFIALDAVISRAFQLRLEASIISAAIRCIAQLALVALILRKVFEADDPWAVAAIAVLLNLMGTLEIVLNKARRRYRHMFAYVLFSNLASTIPVAIIGIRFAMSEETFWKPSQYIPVVGMLCGNTISGIVVVVNFILEELHENKDKVETYLAFGASRLEACKPIATEGLRLALTPTVSTMSVLGIVSIPGMMTGAILGGASVEQAARLQMVIMFMIAASTALASIAATMLTLSVVIDAEHRVRMEQIDDRRHAVWRARNAAISKVAEGLRAASRGVASWVFVLQSRFA
ncbi:hypothetical protein PHLGIDRAFT_115059 [Phlebiopsis gigantea 11061_1 CR5-6]|uniref:Uncharacterized protein n=1 Tax=Phlebiopsis gigantea (strain 11061_1 CR5-6) TaxID=745531 RepID=A0A0C3SEU0_PHLG1|nr:hypothetical protein PHLGIDRAFT_115059 [Phlebiopsis gigantea 11061_1 CR5-6]